MSSASMPSSPAASRSGSPASVILTPGAKVRALLAQFDSDSEQDVSAEPGNATRIAKTTISAPQIDARSDATASEEEDDDLPVRPRGRMAAKMQTSDLQPETDSDGADDDSDAAYQRIRRQLIRKPAERDPDSAEETEEGPKRGLLKRRSSPMADHQSSAASRQRSVSPLFFPSPSPSKRARLSTPAHAADSDSDDSTTTSLQKKPNPRFMALVEKQRQKRLALEAAEANKREDRLEQVREQMNKHGRPRGPSPADLSEEDSGSDEGAGKKLTQYARPARKASKKALEEMSRETQRMSRNMQLAHQAQTKKKVTKESLLARFNFTLPGAAKEPASSTTASSAPNSDGEVEQIHATPPTSPLREPSPQPEKTSTASIDHVVEPLQVYHMEPSAGAPDVVLDVVNQSEQAPDKGKYKAIEEVSRSESVAPTGQKRMRQFRAPLPQANTMSESIDLSDDDLEVAIDQSATRKLGIFDKMPTKKINGAPSHVVLRSLAHLNGSDNGRGKKRSTMTAVEMQNALRRQARYQAAQERAEKIAELKAKGVYIQTSEEREKEQQEVEDLVEKARHEAMSIQKREERKAKKDGTFEDDGLDDDDEYDGEYDGNEDEQLSGSEEEGEEDGEEDVDDDENHGSAAEDDNMDIDNNDGLIAHMASEAGSEDEEEGVEEDDLLEDPFIEEDHDDETDSAKLPTNRRRKVQRALLDSDDEDMEEPKDRQIQKGALDITATPQAIRNGSPVESPVLPAMSSKTPQSIIRSARKLIPGLPLSDDMPIGLTQAFAATMADSQSQDSPSLQEQDSLAMIQDLPEPQFPSTLQRLDSIDMITDSQPASQTQTLGLNLSFPQSQSQSQIVPESPVRVSATQYSELPEPTQDTDFVLSPFADRRFDTPVIPHSTVDTVLLPMDASPVVQRRGRLRRGNATRSEDQDDMGELLKDPSAVSAFEKMREAAREKERREAFDKSKSNAKEAVDEAAEESEDEYAGLGGASDDEDGVELEEDRRMINDDSNEKVDERQLAALHANKERAEDEAAVSKLLQDITTGRLRRKRGAGGFDDLDLSDDESAHARRREAKRREFAKMRRELLVNSDERLGKIAEDPKKVAFLKALEDRDDEDDVNLDLEFHEADPESQSQSQSQPQEIATEAVPNSGDLTLEAEAKPADREPLQPAQADALNRAAPVPERRRKAVNDRRPQTLAEIRESVSFLVEDPVDPYANGDDSDSDAEAHENLDQAAANAFMESLDADDADDDMDDFVVQDEDREEPLGDKSIFKKPNLPASRAPGPLRRTESRGPVVDRLSLMRQSSSSTSGSTASSNGKLAFFTSSSASTSFKVPSLLRRATSNSSFGSSNEKVSATGVTTMTERGSAGSDKEMIRKGAGGQKSSVGYYRNSRAQQRDEAMKKRLAAGNATGAVEKAVKGKKMGGGGVLGGLVKRNSWQ